MCDVVWVSPQSHNSLSVKPHFLWHALQWPWPVRKRFSSDHWCLWRSKPGSRIVGSTTNVELTTVADCQSSLHQLVTSIICKSLHSGLRDSRWSGGGWKTSSYNGQSRWHSACYSSKWRQTWLHTNNFQATAITDSDNWQLHQCQNISTSSRNNYFYTSFVLTWRRFCCPV